MPSECIEIEGAIWRAGEGVAPSPSGLIISVCTFGREIEYVSAAFDRRGDRGRYPPIPN